VHAVGVTDLMMSGVAASSANADAVALYAELPGIAASVRSARLFVADALGNCPRR